MKQPDPSILDAKVILALFPKEQRCETRFHADLTDGCNPFYLGQIYGTLLRQAREASLRMMDQVKDNAGPTAVTDFLLGLNAEMSKTQSEDRHEQTIMHVKRHDGDES